ncbi:MAG: glutamine-hydrolyzing carbamoyl-phosphate synthase small subunit [Oscillospiraceae bacterium]|nr:glutamine-hydrolyzing carbamoyl-phosphate synthase small subunit [Oscillospiraceae bacterium]
MNKKAWLVLADGTVFEGQSFGAEGEVIGEIVFTTSMTGFQETLTDPNYNNQIIVQTFTLSGNSGVNNEDNTSDYGGAVGYIVREHCSKPSNFRAETTIDEFLKERKIIGLCGIDTRRLTRILRDKGTMNGKITTTEPVNPDLKEIAGFSPGTDLISVAEPAEFKAAEPKYKVALIDYGHKREIIRLLNMLGCDVDLIPFTESAESIIDGGYDGVVLSNGAGNPSELNEEIETIKTLKDKRIPLLGLGLGHQLLALANGGTTAKLKYGHRGANQPVIELETGRTFITSQNHGFIVRSIPDETGKITHVNANDRTCEAIEYKENPSLSAQFIPSDSGGVNATICFIEKFIELIK